jgi:hyperosmotically inducible periplasmic protein
MWIILLAASMVCVFTHSAYGAPDSGPAGEGHHKESAPPPIDKKKPDDKKPDTDLKPADSNAKPAPDEKAQKADEPPVAPPKPEDSGGKKPVTSPNLTIKLALMADPSLFPFELEVEMDGQKATLTGAVSSEEEKTRAADIAKNIEGVESVNNNLSISPAIRTAWTKKQDEALVQLVKERLNKSETLRTVGFDVKSDNGIVFLSGKTRFQVIALEAAEAARHVPGVRAVNSSAVQMTGKE